MSHHSKKSLHDEIRLLQLKRDSILAGAGDADVSDTLEKYSETVDALLKSERELAMVEKRPYAVPMEWKYPWTNATNFSLCFNSDYKTFFTYDHLSGDQLKGMVAVVRIDGAYAIQCGGPNDEARCGHPLFGSGLGDSGAYMIENSPWIEQHSLINSAHRQYNAAMWDKLKHIVWLFHDGQIEVIAKDVSVGIDQGKRMEKGTAPFI